MGGPAESLLLLARLEELPETPLVEVDLTKLAEYSGQDTRAAASDREVLVDSGRQVHVFGDPEQLRQVLANLARSAVVHIPLVTTIEQSARRMGRPWSRSATTAWTSACGWRSSV
jgi:signal transduction histidine kinase